MAVHGARDRARRALLLLHERLGLGLVGLLVALGRVVDRLLLLGLVVLPLVLEVAAKLVHELAERALLVADEVGVGALLRHLAVLEADDVVDAREEVQGVRDEDARLAGEGAEDGVVEQVLADVRIDLREGHDISTGRRAEERASERRKGNAQPRADRRGG